MAFETGQAELFIFDLKQGTIVEHNLPLPKQTPITEKERNEYSLLVQQNSDKIGREIIRRYESNNLFYSKNNKFSSNISGRIFSHEQENVVIDLGLHSFQITFVNGEPRSIKDPLISNCHAGAFTPDETRAYFANDKQILSIDLLPSSYLSQKLLTIYVENTCCEKILNIIPLNNNKILCAENDNWIKLRYGNTGELITSKQMPFGISEFVIADSILIIKTYNKVYSININTLDYTKLIDAKEEIYSLTFLRGRKKIICYSTKKGDINFYNIESKSIVAGMRIFNKFEYLISMNDCNFMANKEWVVNKCQQDVSFRNFEIKYNRPSKVLECLGFADKNVIIQLEKDYQRRQQISAQNNLDNSSSDAEKISFKSESENIQKGDLHFIAVGISKYKSGSLKSLNYARKDLQDITSLFTRRIGTFNKVYIYEFLDARAKKHDIIEIRKALLKCRSQDKVIFYFSGHGGIDAKTNENILFTYDYGNLESDQKGLSITDVEGILKDIPASTKLVFIDACNSGVTQTPKYQQIKNQNTKNQNVVFRDGMDNSAMLDFLFKNTSPLPFMTNSNADIYIMSATTGIGKALESDSLKNGIFSHYFIKGISKFYNGNLIAQSRKGNLYEKFLYGDLNKDKKLYVSELYQYISREVRLFTHSEQNPENHFDFLDNNFLLIDYTNDFASDFAIPGGEYPEGWTELETVIQKGGLLDADFFLKCLEYTKADDPNIITNIFDIVDNNPIIIDSLLGNLINRTKIVEILIKTNKILTLTYLLDDLKLKFLNKQNESYASVEYGVFAASEKGNLEMIKFLQSRNLFNINKISTTCFYQAVKYNKTDVAEYMLNYGARVDATDGERNALHQAVIHKNLKISRLLLEKGASVNRISDTTTLRRTPIHEACFDKSVGPEIVRLLIQHKANVDVQDAYKSTPLHLATRAGNIEVVKILLEAGAKKELKNIYGKTPMDIANEIEVNEIIMLLK
jgi:hypothetical protein